jgi:hypothetical protein
MKTAAKSKVSQRGEVVTAVKMKDVRISKGIHVFSTNPQYDIINTMSEPPHHS